MDWVSSFYSLFPWYHSLNSFSLEPFFVVVILIEVSFIFSFLGKLYISFDLLGLLLRLGLYRSFSFHCAFTSLAEKTAIQILAAAAYITDRE